MRNKYCTICKKVVKEVYGRPKFNGKFYTLCSEECYRNYVQNIWRNKEDKEKYHIQGDTHKKSMTHSPPEIPQEIEEFPDY